MDLQPADGVPDALYIALQDLLYEPSHCEPRSEELRTGRLLRVHRDWLNGGFAQTFYNLEASDEPFAPYVQAYADIGLTAAETIVAKAASVWPVGRLSDFDAFTEGSEQLYKTYEQLDEVYLRLTYGEGEVRPMALRRLSSISFSSI